MTIERVLVLLKDRHPGLSAWSEIFAAQLKKLRESANKALHD
ncbi:MAG: hypothetical protein V1821_02710 [bacterium]